MSDWCKLSDSELMAILPSEGRAEFVKLRGLTDEEIVAIMEELNQPKDFKLDQKIAAAVQWSEKRLGEKWWHKRIKE